MVTIGSQASGDTGLKIWISGLIAPFTVVDRPQAMPSGTAISVAIRKPRPTVFSDVRIWSTIGRLAGVVALLDLSRLALGDELGVALVLALVERRLLVPFRLVVLPQGAGLLPHLRRPGQGAERGVDARREHAPGDEEDGDADKRDDQQRLADSPSCSLTLSPAAMRSSGVSQPSPNASSQPAALLMRWKTPLPAESAPSSAVAIVSDALVMLIGLVQNIETWCRERVGRAASAADDLGAFDLLLALQADRQRVDVGVRACARRR